MTEQELINKLNKFQEIKPNKDWAHWLLSNILTKSHQEVMIKPRVKLVSFSFIHQYQKALVSAAFVVLFVSTFAFAQTTLPGNTLYPLKTLTQDARIYFASEKTKPIVRLETIKTRLEDLSKVENHEKEISVIVKNIGKDLEIVPQEIKKINNKQVALNVSKDVQERSKDLKIMADRISLGENKEEFNKSVENYQSQVLAYIIGATEDINQCPSYLQNRLVELGKYFTDAEKGLYQWSPDNIIKSRNLLIEASNAFKAGDCPTATEKIESINTLLKILSLDIKVETSTPEN